MLVFCFVDSQVQEAVADCLSPLVPAIKQDAPNIVKKMLKLLLESENYAERRGAAYGLAGLVKGLDILAMKQLDIMTALTDAIQNKKNSRYREGGFLRILHLPEINYINPLKCDHSKHCYLLL